MEENKKISKLQLISSKAEAGNVRTFIFEAGSINWVAGQYQGYILTQAGKTEAENQRWFTIASAPSESMIHISTRVSDSAFKQALDALVPGDMIQAHSLEGDFTWEEETIEPVVLIAGGIGVTPFRSILLERHAAGKPLNATLLYFNRTNEIPFREEIEAFARKHPEFTYVPIVGEQITADTILERSPQVNDKTFYLSGPEPMVESIGNELKGLGLNLKQDWFPGYNEENY
ncbi:MAG: FAD-dependent oxidoreductase [Deltaproteobacteria bacterium]